MAPLISETCHGVIDNGHSDIGYDAQRGRMSMAEVIIRFMFNGTVFGIGYHTSLR